MNPVGERQRWLAALALAVAVPLPLTGYRELAVPAAVSWRRRSGSSSSRRPLAPPPAWLENVLAPLILAAVVAAGGVRYGVLRPVSAARGARRGGAPPRVRTALADA